MLPRIVAGRAMAFIVLADFVGGVAQRGAGLQIEGDGARDEEALMIDAKGVWPGPKWLKAASGIIVSLLVLTAAPADVPCSAGIGERIGLRVARLIRPPSIVALAGSGDR